MTGMAAGGDYAANSLSQQACFRLLVPHVRDALGTGHHRVLADYGSADGLATRQLLEALSDLSQLDVVLNDLPANDWQMAHEILSPIGTLSVGQPIESLLAEPPASPGVRLLSAPGSFHEQVLPDASVDVAVSGTAFHWLSDTTELARPGACVFFRGDPAVAPAWYAHSANDWAAILNARAAELKPGGTLAVVLPSMMPDGDYIYRVLFEILDALYPRSD